MLLAGLSSQAAVLGDVDGNGTVDVADVNAAINVMLGKAENATADVTGDGQVDVADVNILINIILKIDNAANYDRRAFITDDDKVDVADVNALINIILKVG